MRQSLKQTIPRQYFTGYPQQILLGPFLNTMSHIKFYGLLIMCLFIFIIYQSINEWKLAKMTGCFTKLYIINLVEDYVVLLLQLFSYIDECHLSLKIVWKISIFFMG